MTGADLDDATQLLFSNTNITATLSDVQTDPRTFRVIVGKEIPPGIYEARVVGRFGVSNPRPFAVSAVSNLMAPQSNTNLARAAPIPLNVVVNGRAVSGAESYFKLELRAGQRVLLECATKGLDSRMDPIMVMYSAAGHELDRSRRQPLLDFIAPAAGDYLLKLHDALFRGGDDYVYRLSVSTGPHIDFIFPPTGEPGTHAIYQVYGRNLPGASPSGVLGFDHKRLDRLNVEIQMPTEVPMIPTSTSLLPLRAASVDLRGIEYRLTTTNGLSNPVFIGAASGPVVFERESNNTPELAQDFSVPSEYTGQFYPANDKDWITFSARKGDVYTFEIVSQRLGFPTAPFLLFGRVDPKDRGNEELADVQEVYGAEANLGGVEFNTAGRDPIKRLEVKQDGRYRVEVRDLFNSGPPNPARLYRFAVRKETPDFQLLALPQSPPQLDKDRREARVWTVFLRRGETVPIKVLVFRRDGFEGEIRLSLGGLPPGAVSSSTRIEPGQTNAVLLLSASEQAAAWAGAVTVIGTSQVDGLEVTRVAKVGTIIWDVNDYNTEAVHSRLTSALYLGIAGEESAPLTIQASPSFEAHSNEKLMIPLQLAGKAELTGNVKLKPAGLPELEKAPLLEINSKTNLATLELDLAQFKLPLGMHQFHIFAQGQAKYRRLTPEEVREAEQAVNAAKAAPKDEKLSQAAKAAEKRLQFEERSFTAYSPLIALKVTPLPTATTASKQ